MKKHLIVIGTAVLLLAVGLSGCNELSNPLTGNDDSRFVGTWKTENGGVVIFFSDGTGSQTSMSFQWEIKDNKLVWGWEISQGISIVYDYQFSDNDTTLTLTTTDNVSQVFTKQ